tara:strand:+ start:230 stop:1435 length:1206 start_codon:yes stop_codon:yes gene_type:complete
MKTTFVVGAGAAGFFAAIHHKSNWPDDRTIIIEKSNDCLTKVKLSGGGRCNVTHACFDPRQLCEFYPRGSKELRGPFHEFQPEDTMAWFESRGVKLKIEPDNRVFPVSNDSSDIANCLMDEAKALGIAVWTSCGIAAINKTDQLFVITLKNGQTHTCNKLILATGSNRQGYQLAESLGHTIVSPVPSLFTFKISDPQLHQLSGLSVQHVQVQLSVGKKQRHNGPLLITHWGMSGPAIIKSSSWHAIELHDTNYSCTMTIDWLPELQPNQIQQSIEKIMHSRPKQRPDKQSPFSELPGRLWAYLIQHWRISLPDHWGGLNKRQIQQMAERVKADAFEISGKGIFKEEFVTCGGVALNEINFSNMESNICPNLHVVGELLNIDGITGGFNFQSAWTTGVLSAN